jgi:hypothetical protein
MKLCSFSVLAQPIDPPREPVGKQIAKLCGAINRSCRDCFPALASLLDSRLVIIWRVAGARLGQSVLRSCILPSPQSPQATIAEA